MIGHDGGLCEHAVVVLDHRHLLDEASHHPEPGRRSRADSLVAVLTPVVKAFLTDNGHHGSNEALQIWGGYGYVHEYGIEQTVRESRIAMVCAAFTQAPRDVDRSGEPARLDRRDIDGGEGGLWQDPILASGDFVRSCGDAISDQSARVRHG